MHSKVIRFGPAKHAYSDVSFPYYHECRRCKSLIEWNHTCSDVYYSWYFVWILKCQVCGKKNRVTD